MQLTKDNWRANDYIDFTNYLKSIADVKNAEFSSKLIPGEKNILGIKIPELRKIAQKITLGDWQGFLKHAKDETFEEILIQGIIIGKAKTDFDTMANLVEAYLPKVNNWAVCDCFCSSIKVETRNKDEMLCLIKECIKSKADYTVRFAVVMLINNYIDDEYIGFILKTLNTINVDSYYVRMSVAWAISVCYVKFTQETEEILLNNDLDNFTFNKAIDKIKDSLRVPMDAKVRLKKLKRKNIAEK